MGRISFPLFLLMVLCIGLAGENVSRGSESSINFRPADTSSPRSTLKEFINASNEIYDRIRENQFLDRNSNESRAIALRMLDCLDQRDLPEFASEQRAAEVAICLKEILDRVDLPPYTEIPGIEEIGDDDGGLNRWRIPGTRITIARVEEGPQKHEYLF